MSQHFGDSQSEQSGAMSPQADRITGDEVSEQSKQSSKNLDARSIISSFNQPVNSLRANSVSETGLADSATCDILGQFLLAEAGSGGETENCSSAESSFDLENHQLSEKRTSYVSDSVPSLEPEAAPDNFPGSDAKSQQQNSSSNSSAQSMQSSESSTQHICVALQQLKNNLSLATASIRTQMYEFQAILEKTIAQCCDTCADAFGDSVPTKNSQLQKIQLYVTQFTTGLAQQQAAHQFVHSTQQIKVRLDKTAQQFQKLTKSVSVLVAQNSELRKDNRHLALSIKKMADAPEEQRIGTIQQQYQNDIASIKKDLVEKQRQNAQLQQQLEDNNKLLANNKTVIARLQQKCSLAHVQELEFDLKQRTLQLQDLQRLYADAVQSMKQHESLRSGDQTNKNTLLRKENLKIDQRVSSSTANDTTRDEQITTYKSQISELERNYIELLGFVETENGQNDTAREHMEILVNQKTALVNELTAQMETVSSLLEHTQQKLVICQEQLKQHESVCDLQSKDMLALRGHVDAIEAEKRSLQQQCSANKTKCREVQKMNQKFAETLKHRNSQLKEAQTTNSVLKNQVDKFAQENDHLRQQNNELVQQNQQLRTDVSTYKQRVSELEAKVAALNQQMLEQIKSENDAQRELADANNAVQKQQLELIYSQLLEQSQQLKDMTTSHDNVHIPDSQIASQGAALSDQAPKDSLIYSENSCETTHSELVDLSDTDVGRGNSEPIKGQQCSTQELVRSRTDLDVKSNKLSQSLTENDQTCAEIQQSPSAKDDLKASVRQTGRQIQQPDQAQDKETRTVQDTKNEMSAGNSQDSVAVPTQICGSQNAEKVKPPEVPGTNTLKVTLVSQQSGLCGTSKNRSNLDVSSIPVQCEIVETKKELQSENATECKDVILHSATRTQATVQSPKFDCPTITVVRKQKSLRPESAKEMHDSACQTQAHQENENSHSSEKSPLTGVTHAPETSEDSDEVPLITVRQRQIKIPMQPQDANTKYSNITQKQFESNNRLIEAAMTEAERSFQHHSAIRNVLTHKKKQQISYFAGNKQSTINATLRQPDRNVQVLAYSQFKDLVKPSRVPDKDLIENLRLQKTRSTSVHADAKQPSQQRFTDSVQSVQRTLVQPQQKDMLMLDDLETLKLESQLQRDLEAKDRQIATLRQKLRKSQCLQDSLCAAAEQQKADAQGRKGRVVVPYPVYVHAEQPKLIDMDLQLRQEREKRQALEVQNKRLKQEMYWRGRK